MHPIIFLATAVGVVVILGLLALGVKNAYKYYLTVREYEDDKKLKED